MHLRISDILYFAHEARRGRRWLSMTMANILLPNFFRYDVINLRAAFSNVELATAMTSACQGSTDDMRQSDAYILRVSCRCRLISIFIPAGPGCVDVAHLPDISAAGKFLDDMDGDIRRRFSR